MRNRPFPMDELPPLVPEPQVREEGNTTIDDGNHGHGREKEVVGRHYHGVRGEDKEAVHVGPMNIETGGNCVEGAEVVEDEHDGKDRRDNQNPYRSAFGRSPWS
mmetsp:Transcript_3005/g.6708  ORF Transcript_3005/g.6708 Transcript_3005/m.6708 type:complete len:104 (+) Transcript_3005:978-1289(+)